MIGRQSGHGYAIADVAELVRELRAKLEFYARCKNADVVKALADADEFLDAVEVA